MELSWSPPSRSVRSSVADEQPGRPMTEPSQTSRLLEEAFSTAATPIADLLRFDDAVCVVTGGAKGIGFAIANRFAELGSGIVLVDQDSLVASAAARLTERHQVRSQVVLGNMCDSAVSVEAAALALTANPSRMIWVNSAGIYPTNRLADLSDEAWSKVIDLDLSATFYGCRAAGLALRERNLPGVIINISSVAGFRVGAPPGIAHYASAKHGVQGLTKALAVELGRDDIRVLCLAPGTVLTEGLIEKFGPPGDGPDDPYAQLARRMPIRRPGLPDDVARVAVFCASPMAAMLTGTVIPVDAGHLTL